MAFRHLAHLRLADRIHAARIAKHGTKQCPNCGRTVIADSDCCATITVRMEPDEADGVRFSFTPG